MSLLPVLVLGIVGIAVLGLIVMIVRGSSARDVSDRTPEERQAMLRAEQEARRGGGGAHGDGRLGDHWGAS